MGQCGGQQPATHVKPERPEGSPLFWHASGRWAKKIRGRFVYFGRGDHADALAEYERQAADLHAGRVPSEEPEGLTVYQLSAKFLTDRKSARDGGELSPRTFQEYADTCKRLIKVFGKHRLVADLKPQDFAKLRQHMGRTWGPVRLAGEVVRSRVPFNWAYKSSLIDKPVVFGQGFQKPSKKVLRQARAAHGPKLFEAAEIRAMLEKASLPLRAMLLLGVQAGFGNADCGNLPLRALDLEKGWATYPRVKTAIQRRIPLWTETTQALRDWLKARPKPAKEEHAGLVFLTRAGDSWAKATSDNPVSKETAKLLRACGLNGHRNFYCLRHVFQTVGDESGDFLAVRKIMGHASDDIADAYRERVSDERLRRVTDHVRAWLFADDGGAGQEPDVIPLQRQAQ
jgi:integrase